MSYLIICCLIIQAEFITITGMNDRQMKNVWFNLECSWMGDSASNSYAEWIFNDSYWWILNRKWSSSISRCWFFRILILFVISTLGNSDQWFLLILHPSELWFLLILDPSPRCLGQLSLPGDVHCQRLADRFVASLHGPETWHRSAGGVMDAWEMLPGAPRDRTIGWIMLHPIISNYNMISGCDWWWLWIESSNHQLSCSYESNWFGHQWLHKHNL